MLNKVAKAPVTLNIIESMYIQCTYDVTMMFSETSNNYGNIRLINLKLKRRIYIIHGCSIMS